MKFFHTFLALLILTSAWGCRGTEVGNGRSRPTPQQNTSPDKADANSPDEEGSETPTEPSAGAGDPEGEMGSFTAAEHLFVNCASPLSETTAGTFVDSLGGEDLVIAADPAGEWMATIGAEETTLTSAATGANPYGISSDAQSKDLACTSVETDMSERTVVYDDEFRIVWTLDNASAVIKIEIFNEAGTLAASYEKP